MELRVGLLTVLLATVSRAALAQDATALERIEFKAGSSTSTMGTALDEYPGGQVARGGRIGLLGNRDFIDTPFNITSYTAETIENQGAQTVADVVANDPSVRSTHASGGMLDSFYVRGFPLNEGNFGEVAFDGVFGVAPTYRLFTDYAERVEILKGPTALLYGISPNSSVGGTINIVPKRASDVDLTRVTTDYASDLYGGSHLDLSRRFGEERQFGVRFNGSFHGGDTPIDNQSRDIAVGALALDYEGEDLRATLDFIGQRENFDAPQRPFFPMAGIEIPDAPDGRSNVQESWEWSKSQDLSWLGRVEYDLSDTVTVFGAVGGGNSRVERLFGTPTILNSAGDVSITPQNFIFDVDRLTAETGIRAAFETEAVEHTVTFQVSGLQQTLNRGSISGTAQLTNLFDPLPRPEQDVPQPSHVPKVSENTFYGFALSDTMSMLDERVQLTLGGRWQHIDTENFSPVTGDVTSSSDEAAVTPLAGIVVKPWENVALYANYVEGLSVGDTAPTTAVNAGETLAPYRSKQYEIGTKIDLGRVAVTVSAFQIEKPFGQLETRGGDLVFIEGGEQRNRGVELSIFGEVTPEVRVLGGVTFIHGELTKTNSATTQGNTPIGVPSVQVNVGAEWDTPFMPGLTLAGNVIHTDEQFVNTANTQKIPSWTRLDLGARYHTEINEKPVTFRAEVENVFDLDYWSGVASFGTISQGAPLTVKVSMTTDF
ncbi:iron complex outermembrane recepter protein [Rhizobium mongolense subsp. loessense]|uniref:Iron complex outermembrane recepter protein n=1 Tax=Rhizobium mongolense subsp. loessense TaxID=158890 RepID=A0A1G4QLR4_9HYPH|nr:TonB-dependent siderophore receptor [Rhizobium mongolense]SCW45397.1 iron complex outermembrane recepter protein [Rhizobium mongolense subsp. loessense]